MIFDLISQGPSFSSGRSERPPDDAIDRQVPESDLRDVIFARAGQRQEFKRRAIIPGENLEM